MKRCVDPNLPRRRVKKKRTKRKRRKTSVSPRDNQWFEQLVVRRDGDVVLDVRVNQNALGAMHALRVMASALLQMNVKNCTFTPLVAREEALLKFSPPLVSCYPGKTGARCI